MAKDRRNPTSGALQYRHVDGNGHRPADARGLWLLRSLAIVIAVASWLFFSFLPRLEERTEPLVSGDFVAVVGYEEPQGYMILKRETHRVTVRVRGRAEQLNSLSPADVRLQVPFPQDFTPNELVEVPLRPSYVSLPQGLQVESLSPDRLDLLIDEKVSKHVGVRPTFQGEPAARATVNYEQTRVEPEEVLVEGPRHELELLETVETERINIANRAVSFRTQVGLHTSAESIRVLQPTLVTVHVVLDVPTPSGESVGTQRR